MASKKTRKSEVSIGSRGSRLALAQAQEVLKKLSAFSPAINFKVKIIKTEGDKDLGSSLATIGGKGVFTKELEDALLSGKIDLAVHSLKDLPTEIPEGLTIGAVTKREDPRDVILTRHFQTPSVLTAFGHLPLNKGENERGLKGKIRIGTSSLRRKAQLLHWNPRLEVVDLRGNIDTRIRKLVEGDYDAIVLAAAGIKRLKIDSKKSKIDIRKIPISQMLPAVGQGFLAVETRKNDLRTMKLIAKLNDKYSEIAASAERSLLSRLGGGCQVPVGAYAKTRGKKLVLKAVVASLDGKQLYRVCESGTLKEAVEIGSRAAKKLLAKGADRILREAKSI